MDDSMGLVFGESVGEENIRGNDILTRGETSDPDYPDIKYDRPRALRNILALSTTKTF